MKCEPHTLGFTTTTPVLSQDALFLFHRKLTAHLTPAHLLHTKYPTNAPIDLKSIS